MRISPRRSCLYILAVVVFYLLIYNISVSRNGPVKNDVYPTSISTKQDTRDVMAIHVKDVHQKGYLNESNLFLLENLLPLPAPRSDDLLQENVRPPKLSRPQNNNRMESSRMEAMRSKLMKLNHPETEQSDPRLIRLIQDYWILPPQNKTYQLSEPHLVDFSAGQSGIIDNFLKHKTGGFFVECGALDGETRSNTLLLERERNWTGLLIEAGPINYRHLVEKNRNAYSSPACLSTKPYPNMMYFQRGKNRGRVMEDQDGLLWVQNQGMKLWLMEVQCFPLYSMMLAVNRTHIDYLSLDVEGAELDVLKTIPFNLLDISLLSVEFTHDKTGADSILGFMKAHGYQHIATYSRTDRLANDFIFKRQPEFYRIQSNFQFDQ